MFALLDRVSEVAMLAMAVALLTVCVWSWKNEKDYIALSYIFPSVYLCFMYAYVVFFPHTEVAQQMFGRSGLFILMMNVLIWRLVFIRRKQKQRYGEY